jgi:hypothetical protein
MIHLSALIAATTLLLVLILFAVFRLRQNSIRGQTVIIKAECISAEKMGPFTYAVTYKYEVNELICRKTCKQIFFAPKPGGMHRLIVDRRALLIAVPLAEMVKWIIIIMLLIALTITVDVAGMHERHIYKLAHQRWP